MFVSVVQQLQFRLLFKEAEKQLVILQGSGKTNHTRLIGTISLKLSSSFRRSLTYGGSCVIFLRSSSISMPFFFNVEREGTIFLPRGSRKWRRLRRRPPFLSYPRSGFGSLYYPIHIPQSLESCNPRLIIARCATCFDDIGFTIILSSPQRFHLSPKPSRLGGSPFLQKLILDNYLGAGEADCVKQHTELVKFDINGSIFRPLFAVPLHCRFQLPQYSLTCNNPLYSSDAPLYRHLTGIT